MDDIDVFTNEIKFSKSGFNNVLIQFADGTPATPNNANYQSCKKMQAEVNLAEGNETLATFYLTEAVSASLRTVALYREEQLKFHNGNQQELITSLQKPLNNIMKSGNLSQEDENLCPFLKDFNVNKGLLEKNNNESNNNKPLFERYLQFSPDNNVANLKTILKELPKEWTIIQLTASYNPNENLKPWDEFKSEVSSIFISVLTNDYLDSAPTLDMVTLQIPANTIKEGENPLFVELYSLLDDNHKTIEKPHLLHNKRLLKNYWDKREEIDLRMKSVINVMDRDWLGGFKALLSGRLVDTTLKDKVKAFVDNTISDWGFFLLTEKQKFLLYNLIESSHWLSSYEMKFAIRKILTEHGNFEQMIIAIENKLCPKCNPTFKYLNELCVKCLGKGFEVIHKFTLLDGIKAFSGAANQVKEDDMWAELKMAKRHPVILIVDELLDTFPWESLPILNIHPVSRMENIHFLYYLYKTHEKDIVDGYFGARPYHGRYVINPENNLDRMEKRMKSFVQYWCPNWVGEMSKPPEPDVFVDYLKKADLFLYCGHGSGCNLAAGGRGGRGAGIEEARGARGAALLSGCGSVALRAAGGRAPPAAPHHHYHVATSPMVIGMLWEVTDLEVDKLVSTLLALYIPSDAPVPWDKVGKSQWSQGIIDTNIEQTSEKLESQTERDLLRAVALSRRSTKFILIATSVVARGLPIKIIQ